MRRELGSRLKNYELRMIAIAEWRDYNNNVKEKLSRLKFSRAQNPEKNEQKNVVGQACTKIFLFDFKNSGS